MLSAPCAFLWRNFGRIGGWLLPALGQGSRSVHDVLQFLQIAEELVGIYEVFVHVVEVADEQFSPEVEVIQSLFTVGLFAEHLIQFAYQADGVTGL